MLQKSAGMAGVRNYGREAYGRTSQSMIEAYRLALAGEWSYNQSTKLYQRIHKIQDNHSFKEWELSVGIQTDSSAYGENLPGISTVNRLPKGLKVSRVGRKVVTKSSRNLPGSHNIQERKGRVSIIDPVPLNIASGLNICDRRFVNLKNEYFGCAAEACQPGDIIVVLGGGPTLYVLRQGPGRNSFTYIGDAYIRGMMDGEAFEAGGKLESFTIM